MLTHKLQAYETGHLRQTLNRIVSIANPEKIFLLAASTDYATTDNIFMPAPVQLPAAPHYFFLVLKKQNDASLNEQLQDKLENNTTLTALVFSIDQFNRWLQSAQPFAIRTMEQAWLCYDAGTTTQAAVSNYDAVVLQARLFTNYHCHHRLATEFLVAADLHRMRRQYNLALFNIHQAAEQLYLAVIRVVTGLNVNTHSIDKLYRYSRWFSPQLAALFMRRTDNEKRLFDILQKAYIHSRYKPGYMAADWETSCLYETVERLKVIVAELVGQQMKAAA
jgi:HEPN domain-containing protein